MNSLLVGFELIKFLTVNCEIDISREFFGIFQDSSGFYGLIMGILQRIWVSFESIMSSFWIIKYFPNLLNKQNVNQQRADGYQNSNDQWINQFTGHFVLLLFDSFAESSQVTGDGFRPPETIGPSSPVTTTPPTCNDIRSRSSWSHFSQQIYWQETNVSPYPFHSWISSIPPLSHSIRLIKCQLQNYIYPIASISIQGHYFNCNFNWIN